MGRSKVTPQDEIEMLKAQVEVLRSNYALAYDAISQLRAVLFQTELIHPSDLPKCHSKLAQANIDMTHKLRQVAQVVNEYSDEVPF